MQKRVIVSTVIMATILLASCDPPMIKETASTVTAPAGSDSTTTMAFLGFPAVVADLLAGHLQNFRRNATRVQDRLNELKALADDAVAAAKKVKQVSDNL